YPCPLLGKHQEISLNLQSLFLSCEFLYKRKLSRQLLQLWVRSDPRTCTAPDSSELFLVCLLYLAQQRHSCERGNCSMDIPKTQLSSAICLMGPEVTQKS
uniref:Uncharacterized protein n=1 Tax=Buteo japonicus TaxID=224669 RepID=A0A8C0HRP9_9AVES